MKYLLLLALLQIVFTGWPAVKFPEHRALPQLEVRVAPPDEYQPEVQAEVKRLDMKREDTEFKYIKALEEAYNTELLGAAKSIKGLIKKAVKMFDNPAILKASVSYAIGAVSKSKKGARFIEEDTQNKIIRQSQSELSQLSSEQQYQQQFDQQYENQPSQQNEYQSDKQKQLQQVEQKDIKMQEYHLIDQQVYKQNQDQKQLQKYQPLNGPIPRMKDDDSQQQRFIENDHKNIFNDLQQQYQNGPIIKKQNEDLDNDRNKFINNSLDNIQINNGPIVLKMTDQIIKDDKPINPSYLSSDIENGPIKLNEYTVKDQQKVNDRLTALDLQNGPIKQQLTQKQEEAVIKQQQVLLSQSNNPTNQNSSISKIQDGPINQSQHTQQHDNNIQQIEDGPIQSFSFLELKEQTSDQSKEPEPLPPVLVKMFKSEKPDAAIQGDMEKLETQRNDIEKKMFKKAESELQLITKQTLQELEANIETEMMPFYAVKDNTLADVSAAVQGSGLSRFRERDEEEFDRTFPIIGSQIKKQQEKVNKIVEDIKKEQLSFLQLNSKLKEKLKSQIKAKEQEKSDADNINVRLAAYENPYPTIFRLINEMESRRDLAERFERLKILEYQMNLQKNEDEMIKDALHSSLALVMAKYGPAIEGVQENLRMA